MQYTNARVILRTLAFSALFTIQFHIFIVINLSQAQPLAAIIPLSEVIANIIIISNR